MMNAILGKVTAFVTRTGASGPELLLFKRPSAGIQIPAGTVEEGEPPEQAALREAREETGLENVRICHYIGFLDERQPEGRYVVLRKTRVYARPDETSFDWAELRRGIRVRLLRRRGSFVQVTYEEWDHFPDPEYLTYQITGWVPEETLCQMTRRHFFHLTTEQELPAAGAVYTDHHFFRPFWAPLPALPDIVAPQRRWLDYVQDELQYEFRCVPPTNLHPCR